MLAYEGKLSFSAAKLEHITVSPSLAEAMTLSWGLKWDKDQRYGKLIVELDA
jgi:hypothetical protein